jgi:DNA-binding FrmR family transcriptional regulator
VPVLGLFRIDRHSADGIENPSCALAVIVMMMVVPTMGVVVCCAHNGLAFYTPGGYVTHMKTDSKTATLKRLSRIEGQVRGLSRMVEEDRYCIDIVTQISAVRAALRRVEEEVLSEHVAHCVEHAIRSGDKDDQRQKIAELMQVVRRADR